ncbi:hypothetical protein HYU11_06410 [Candidatus Woesearchaeota archaeon]|nr:hypothetical protein [Candidatus Woesearchaeota archaeon]
MPHQCVRCNAFYDETADEIMKGCACGGKLFFFIKKEKLESMKQVASSLTENEKEQIEEDVLEIIGETEYKDDPVVLDLETVRIMKPGKYELDLVQLFKNEPLIYKVEDGKYIIDVIRSFGLLKKDKEKD